MGVSELEQKIQMQIDEALLEVDNKQTISHDLVMEETQKRYPKYFKNENLIIAYDSSGKPLSLKDYNEEIDKGISDFENGNAISHEEVLNEIKI